jgi:LysM repeat protein
MSKKFLFVLTISLIVVLALSGCQKSASKSPVGTATNTSNIPFPTPIGGEDPMKNILSGTQTAQALNKSSTPGQATVAPTTAPKPGQPTVAPTVAPTAAPKATEGPVPTKAPAVPTGVHERPSSYTLQAGEYPYCIARRFNVDAAALLSLNGLSLDSKPYVGFVLKIPSGGSWSSGSRALASHPTTYTVKGGDTVYRIACAYGDVYPEDLIAVNGLKSPYTLTTGMTLQIP